MRKTLFLFLVFLLGICLAGMSCPICGCGGGNVYMGLLPDFKYQFIGFRFHTTQYHTQLINDPSQFSTNTYNTVELWGGVRLGKKITVTPNLGMGYENVAINQLERKSVQYTGSEILTSIAGVEFDFGKMGLGINGQLPLAQNFAEGQTKMKFNTMMHVTYQF